MKVFAVFVLVLAGLIPCYADTWDVQASCYQMNQYSPPCFDPAIIDAVLTTTLETGTFYNSVQDVRFTVPNLSSRALVEHSTANLLRMLGVGCLMATQWVAWVLRLGASLTTCGGMAYSTCSRKAR